MLIGMIWLTQPCRWCCCSYKKVRDTPLFWIWRALHHHKGQHRDILGSREAVMTTQNILDHQKVPPPLGGLSRITLPVPVGVPLSWSCITGRSNPPPAKVGPSLSEYYPEENKADSYTEVAGFKDIPRRSTGMERMWYLITGLTKESSNHPNIFAEASKWWSTTSVFPFPGTEAILSHIYDTDVLN